MNFTSVLNKSEPHQRTVIHLDCDCFYAQVEEIRNPSLRAQPLGIQQKNIVVTCNYVARSFGIKKLMLVPEARELCPNLVLVNGEDLTPYRQMSQKIFDILLNYTPAVEKLGFDENFMDVTALVDTRLKQMAKCQADMSDDAMSIAESADGNQNEMLPSCLDMGDDIGDMPEIVGHLYPEEGLPLEACSCGCARRLAIGSQIAKEVREELHVRLGITCCAGISYNKLLAKLVGSQNKPNDQTVLVSTYAEQFMRDLKSLHRVTGIGQKTESLLLENNISNIEELQNCDMEFLRKKLGFETATKLKDLSFGKDTGPVRPTGKPKSIGLEDSCKPISVQKDVEERFRLLLMRLMEQVAEDGRIPIALKVILRKFDPQKKTSHRETKQANILPSLFKAFPSTDAAGIKVMLAEGAQDKLLKIIMRLFEKIVDLKKPFHVTLLGLAFSKFQQRKTGSSSIANFLIKKTDLEVQSITSLTNTSAENIVEPPATPSTSANSQSKGDEAFRSSPTSFQPSDQFYRRRATAASPLSMLTDNGSESGATNSDFSDFSETEVEPSPKKSRIGRLLAAKRRCMGSTSVGTSDCTDVASPSKLRVCDLRLNSRDSEKDFPMNGESPSNSAASNAPRQFIASLQRFRTVQPPSSLGKRPDVGDNGRLPLFFNRRISMASSASSTSPSPSPLPSPMDEGCVISPTTPAAMAASIATTSIITTCCESDTTANSPQAAAVVTGSLSDIPCPHNIDPNVFNELPVDVQNELITSWRRSFASAAVNNLGNVQTSAVVSVSGGVAVSSSPGGLQQQTSKSSTTTTAKVGGATNSAPSGSVVQKNTLYRYFLRNK